MKILILGTSNSVMKKGWLFAFRSAARNAHIDNVSIGGCPGSQFVGYLSWHLEDYDYIIYDTIPTEEDFSEFVGDSDYFERLSFQLMSSIARRSKLIVLGFTQRKTLINKSQIYEYQKIVTSKIGAQFIDIADMVLKYGETFLPEGSSLYEHRSHPNASISRVIGKALAECIHEGGIAFPRASQDYSNNFSSLTIEDVEFDGEIVQRSNSLLSEKFARISDGGSIILRSTSECIGFHINSSHCHGAIICRSLKESRLKKLYYSTPGDLIVKFIPIYGGLNINKLEFVPESDIVKYESFFEDSPKADMAPISRDMPVVEISRFSFWHDDGQGLDMMAPNFESGVLSEKVSKKVEKLHLSLSSAAV